MMRIDDKHLGKIVDFQFIADGLIRGKLLRIGTVAALGEMAAATYTVEVGATKYRIS
jgi:hypothetical protein